MFQIKDWGSKALVVPFLVKGLNKLSEMGKKQEECILRRQIWGTGLRSRRTGTPACRAGLGISVYIWVVSKKFKETWTPWLGGNIVNQYTSNLLCHFVGRSKATDEERFQLLLLIIRGQRLIANLASPDKPSSEFHSGYQCENVGEIFGKCDCVCFCDIPDDALGIHTSKYSKFGMGFEKEFIASQGAHPVMYVPINYPIVERSMKSNIDKTPSKYFPQLLTETMNMLPLSIMTLSTTDLKIAKTILYTAGGGGAENTFDAQIRNDFFSRNFIPHYYGIMSAVGTLMAYVKLFDATLPDDHIDNYYMEREWRSLNNISFSLNDIKTIYLPGAEFKDRFLREFPEYGGSVKLFDDDAE